MTLLELLNPIENQQNISINEDFESFSYTAEFLGSNLEQIYNNEYINSIFDTCSDRDEVKIYIDYEGDSRVIFRDINTIQENLSEEFESDNTYLIRIEISKKIIENRLSIYSSNTFVTWLKSFQKLENCFNRFSKLMMIQGQIQFELLDDKHISLATSKFTFFKQAECPVSWNKNKLLEQRKDYCFVSGKQIPDIIPEDFYLLERSDDEKLNILFDKLCLFSTLTFITDITEIKDNSIYYKLYGYKTIKNDFTFEDLDIDNLQALFKIYQWIYHDDNHSSISDKLGIARNLLTLHLENNNLNSIKGDVYAAIKSNFDIYLKENVQRYLEVKNQVSAFIHDMSIKAESHAESFVETMKNTLLVFISYFLSIIIVTAIDKGKFVNVFTFEVTVITMVILTIAWFYRKNTINDINAKTKRFNEKYINFKERYSDIIEPDNFDSLFNEDKDHNSDVEYIKNTVKKYDPLWKWTILSFGLMTLLFCFYHDTATCFDNMIHFVAFIIGLFNG